MQVSQAVQADQAPSKGQGKSPSQGLESVSPSAALQGWPPYAGAGLVQVLDLETVLAPQVTGQDDQPLQLDQAPSTETESQNPESHL